MTRSLMAALAAAVLLLGGCSSEVPGPGRADVDVDTPQLRQMKAEAGIEDCVPGTAEAVAGGLPEVTLPCLGGGPDVDLSTLRGPMVVSLWASWCGPCRKEMPVVADFHKTYGEQVPVLGIDYQDPQTEPAMELATESAVTYPLVADPQGDLQAQAPFPARMLVPAFVFVDADGHAEVVPGGVSSIDEMVDLANTNLGTDL